MSELHHHALVRAGAGRLSVCPTVLKNKRGFSPHRGLKSMCLYGNGALLLWWTINRSCHWLTSDASSNEVHHRSFTSPGCRRTEYDLRLTKEGSLNPNTATSLHTCHCPETFNLGRWHFRLASGLLALALAGYLQAPPPSSTMQSSVIISNRLFIWLYSYSNTAFLLTYSTSINRRSAHSQCGHPIKEIYL